jgi:archaellum component FlaD/FlaE
MRPYGSLARLEGKLSERETCDGCEQEIKTIKKHIAALKKSGQNW